MIKTYHSFYPAEMYRSKEPMAIKGLACRRYLRDVGYSHTDKYSLKKI